MSVNLWRTTCDIDPLFRELSYQFDFDCSILKYIPQKQASFTRGGDLDAISCIGHLQLHSISNLFVHSLAIFITYMSKILKKKSQALGVNQTN